MLSVSRLIDKLNSLQLFVMFTVPNRSLTHMLQSTYAVSNGRRDQWRRDHRSGADVKRNRNKGSTSYLLSYIARGPFDCVSGYVCSSVNSANIGEYSSYFLRVLASDGGSAHYPLWNQMRSVQILYPLALLPCNHSFHIGSVLTKLGHSKGWILFNNKRKKRNL